MTLYTFTIFDVHQTDFTLLVREKFCLMSIIYCFVLFQFPLIFLFCFVFYFHYRGGDEQKVRFLY